MNTRELSETSPIITAVKSEEGLSHAMETDSTVVFILYGTILNIQKIVDRIKDHGKLAVVHADLIAGLSPKEVVIDFIGESTSANGIINTEPILVRHTIELDLIGGQRAFLIDSMVLDNMRRQLESFRPDFMESTSGVIPGVFHTIRQVTDTPLVIGGLPSDRKDIMTAFDVDVDAVSTMKEQLWCV